MSKYHEVKNVRLDGDILQITVDGKPHQVDLSKHSKRLAGADPKINLSFGLGVKYAYG